MGSRTLTALYTEASAAEVAMEKLRAIGVPQDSLEVHPAGDGDVAPGNAPSGGLFGLRDLVAPERSAGGGAVLVALHVPDALVSEAAEILNEGAIEVDKERDD